MAVLRGPTGGNRWALSRLRGLALVGLVVAFRGEGEQECAYAGRVRCEPAALGQGEDVVEFGRCDFAGEQGVAWLSVGAGGAAAGAGVAGAFRAFVHARTLTFLGFKSTYSCGVSSESATCATSIGSGAYRPTCATGA